MNSPGPVDKPYCDWVRLRECTVATYLEDCQGEIEAHHVTGRGMGGSKRDDRDVVSLCSLHHRRYHDGNLNWTKDELLLKAHETLKEYLDEVVIPSETGEVSMKLPF